MVLMKLRLNMPFKDLAYRFKNISVSSISRTFSAWMIAMDNGLSPPYFMTRERSLVGYNV